MCVFFIEQIVCIKNLGALSMSLNYVTMPETLSESGANLFSDSKIAEYVKSISKIKPLSVEQEQELAKKAKEGHQWAKNALVQANLKLVIAIARKVIHTSKLPMTDLIQEGNIGLMVAVDKFNYKFGFRFSTYAAWWIKQAMFKAISEQSYCVKIPVYIQETLSRYSKIKAEMEKETQKTVSIEDVAQKMNIDASKIDNYLGAYKKTLSLEADFEIKNGSEVKLADIIEDKKSSVSEEIEYSSMKQEIVNLLSDLKDREQKVILFRFGIDGREKRTLEEIGKFYGVTKECIRQTESRALNKLRQNQKVLSLYENYVY